APSPRTITAGRFMYRPDVCASSRATAAETAERSARTTSLTIRARLRADHGADGRIARGRADDDLLDARFEGLACREDLLLHAALRERLGLRERRLGDERRRIVDVPQQPRNVREDE